MSKYAQLTGIPATIDESLEAFEFTVPEFKHEGETIKPNNGMGEPLTFTMHPINGTRYKKSVRKMHIKVSRSEKDADKDAELTEAELDEAVSKADFNTSELLARMCDGWNMTDGKAPVEFILKDVTEMFSELEALRNLVDEEATKRGKKLKAKKIA